VQSLYSDINPQPNRDQVDNDSERTEGECPEGKDIYQVAYDHGDATYGGQTPTALSIDRKADHLTNSITSTGSQYQVEVEERHKAVYYSPDNTTDNSHAQRRADSSEVVHGSIGLPHLPHLRLVSISG
jgi:hypothetical protein